MLDRITAYLKNPDFDLGVKILTEIKIQPAMLKNISRVNNRFNFDKVKYLIIKKFGELIKQNVNEKNYKHFLNSAPKPVQQKPIQTAVVRSQKGITTAIPAKEAKLIDEEYKIKFAKYPKKLQALIIEKGKCSRERAVLHKECRNIKGNSANAKKHRALKLQQMDDLTARIKEIHGYIELYDKK